MIIDYDTFGDVLSFDTTYQMNREHIPLASFIGLNNHRKMVIFGGALMYDETADSFQWLFETFLRAMSGKNPKTILIDQDVAMSKAISFVMTEVYHMLCVWHMEQNVAKHLNQIYKRYASFHGDFGKCIYEYEDEAEFMDAWNIMLDEYNLHENEWLQGIYALREKLFAAYGKKTFSGGMIITQLSESLNGDLKDYL
ncbi:protein FAR1-RELATED SEQUENCE 5-like [Nicotiana tabacum]|uniref:Protein FAR1-RELATED SEQUENCE 5-like n=1 Tax=Nicotiana tabacum TaxID=4097 RepID=A0AC58U2Q7_TOBAC